MRLSDACRSAAVWAGSYRGPPCLAALIWHIFPITVLPWTIRELHLGKEHRLPDRAKSCLIVGVLGADGSCVTFILSMVSMRASPDAIKLKATRGEAPHPLLRWRQDLGVVSEYFNWYEKYDFHIAVSASEPFTLSVSVPIETSDGICVQVVPSDIRFQAQSKVSTFRPKVHESDQRRFLVGTNPCRALAEAKGSAACRVSRLDQTSTSDHEPRYIQESHFAFQSKSSAYRSRFRRMKRVGLLLSV